MAVSDYSTTPDENVTISGINIAEGCAPSGINNAIRQMMADIKAKITSIEAIYLPLSGGEMSGGISFANGNYGNNTHDIIIGAGSSYDDGGAVVLRAKNSSYNPGCFELNAANGNVVISLIGNCSEELSWGNKPVECIDSSGEDWIRFTSGMQICWGRSNYQNYQIVTYPKPFINLPGVCVGNGDCLATSWYTSQFTIAFSNEQSSLYCSWTAVGYWK